MSVETTIDTPLHRAFAVPSLTIALRPLSDVSHRDGYRNRPKSRVPALSNRGGPWLDARLDVRPPWPSFIWLLLCRSVCVSISPMESSARGSSVLPMSSSSSIRVDSRPHCSADARWASYLHSKLSPAPVGSAHDSSTLLADLAFCSIQATPSSSPAGQQWLRPSITSRSTHIPTGPTSNTTTRTSVSVTTRALRRMTRIPLWFSGGI